MSTEFKKIISKNETYYVLEDASAGATSAGAVASVAMPLGPIRRRIKKLREKVEKVSVPKAKPRNPAGMGSNPGRGTKVHKNKKQDQKKGKEKHKKPFYENLLDEINTIADIDPLNELSTEKLAQYKTAAGKAASAADKAGDYKKGDKRFRGIVKATKKQFKNETEPKKKVSEVTRRNFLKKSAAVAASTALPGTSSKLAQTFAQPAAAKLSELDSLYSTALNFVSKYYYEPFTNATRDFSDPNGPSEQDWIDKPDSEWNTELEEPIGKQGMTPWDEPYELLTTPKGREYLATLKYGGTGIFSYSVNGTNEVIELQESPGYPRDHDPNHINGWSIVTYADSDYAEEIANTLIDQGKLKFEEFDQEEGFRVAGLLIDAIIDGVKIKDLPSTEKSKKTSDIDTISKLTRFAGFDKLRNVVKNLLNQNQSTASDTKSTNTKTNIQALPAPKVDPNDVIAQMQQELGRSLTDQEKEVVNQEVNKKDEVAENRYTNDDEQSDIYDRLKRTDIDLDTLAADDHNEPVSDKLKSVIQKYMYLLTPVERFVLHQLFWHGEITNFPQWSAVHRRSAKEFGTVYPQDIKRIQDQALNKILKYDDKVGRGELRSFVTYNTHGKRGTWHDYRYPPQLRGPNELLGLYNDPNEGPAQPEYDARMRELVNQWNKLGKSIRADLIANSKLDKDQQNSTKLLKYKKYMKALDYVKNNPDQNIDEGSFKYDKKTGQMKQDNSNPDQRYGLFINSRLTRTYNTKGEAENVKRRDPKFKNAVIKPIDPSNDLGEGLKDRKDNPCWKGYKPVGTKKKNGRTVPNCVPVKEDRYIASLMNKLYKVTK